MEEYYGRRLTENGLDARAKQYAQTQVSMREEKGELFCNRCNSKVQKREYQLPTGAYYCRECLLLGRVCSDQPLYFFPQQPFPKRHVLHWEGHLTPLQEKVSKGLLESVKQSRHTLVHAVTGAGKTEMIYQVVDHVISKGGAVCIASPRIDVCIELHRRMEKDFSCEIALLHGESEEYVRSPLVIATTHQLLKFYQAFDLLIIDEVDAFPYVDNPMLYYAVEQAVKPTGLKFFLTATSTPALDKLVQSGALHLLRLPRRFHGNPLVVPKKVWFTSRLKNWEANRLPSICMRKMTEQRQTGFPLLIFVPEIHFGKQVAKTLQHHFKQETVGFVSSQTPNRLEIVNQFRKKECTILVSTTILERGVTFPSVDVFVFDAHHQLFSSSSLIQIAGRVGRSSDRPTGEVLFFHHGTTQAIEAAINEIKQMNQEAADDSMFTV